MGKKILLLPVLVAALLTLSASAAQAGAFVLLTLEDLAGGGPVEISDNLAGDANTADNVIRFVGTVGSFNATITANTYYGDTVGPTGAPVQIKVSNFQVYSTSAGTLKATLSGTGLFSPLLGPSVVGIGSSLATITGAGSASVQNSIDGTTVYSRAFPGAAPPSTSNPLLIGSDVDLETVLTFTFNGGATMMGSADLQVRNSSVPEPTTLLLFGPGIAGLAALRRRRRSKTL